LGALATSAASWAALVARLLTDGARLIVPPSYG
jgi:hypothetical protein